MFFVFLSPSSNSFALQQRFSDSLCTYTPCSIHILGKLIMNLDCRWNCHLTRHLNYETEVCSNKFWDGNETTIQVIPCTCEVHSDAWPHLVVVMLVLVIVYDMKLHVMEKCVDVRSRRQASVQLAVERLTDVVRAVFASVFWKVFRLNFLHPEVLEIRVELDEIGTDVAASLKANNRMKSTFDLFVRQVLQVHKHSLDFGVSARSGWTFSWLWKDSLHVVSCDVLVEMKCATWLLNLRPHFLCGLSHSVLVIGDESSRQLHVFVIDVAENRAVESRLSRRHQGKSVEVRLWEDKLLFNGLCWRKLTCQLTALFVMRNIMSTWASGWSWKRGLVRKVPSTQIGSVASAFLGPSSIAAWFRNRRASFGPIWKW